MGRALLEYYSMSGGGRGDIGVGGGVGGGGNLGSILLLFCMVVISLSIVSMIIFVCGEHKSKTDRGGADGGAGCGAACGGGCGGCGG